MEVTGKVINECEALKNAFEMHDDPVSEIYLPVESADLKNAFALLSLFDLDKPYFPLPICLLSEHRQAFLKADQPALKFLHGLPDEEKAGIEIAIDYLECDRLDDCLRAFFFTVIYKFFDGCHSNAEEQQI
uniref:Glutathione transferase n=1 Tax=Panagrellus redivivus TaxID=6233 RepID=A0A7E4VLT2_PANRE